MYAALGLLSLVGLVAANPSLLLSHVDNGQWNPIADGSLLGSGLIHWGHDDGSWKPALDGSILGSGHLTWLHRRKRSLWGINPNTLPVPLDTAHVAHAKQAQLISQHTEGTRNILGGGIPLALPADTHEVAVGKQAHAIAHARQAAITGHGHGLGVVAAAPVAVAAAPVAVAAPVVGLGVAGVGAWGHGAGVGAWGNGAGVGAWGNGAGWAGAGWGRGVALGLGHGHGIW